MATNVRAYRQSERVIDPAHLAEFDRMLRSSPSVVLLAGAMLFVVACWVGLTQPLGAGTVLAVLAGTAVLTVTAVLGFRLGSARDDRVQAISRDIAPLRAVAVFDEEAVSDAALWDASALAEDIWQLVMANERLDDAVVRTAAQEIELAEYHAERERLGRVLLGMLHPAAV